MIVTATRKMSGKKEQGEKRKLGLTMHKHKTANDARGFVSSFFSKAYIFDIYQTKR
jgi:hypothetical protein